MSKERELLQFILNSHAANGSKLDKFWKAKIEELLAQPEQEPFAWCIESKSSADWCFAADKLGVIENAKLLGGDCDRSAPFPLYTAPPKREPLSEDAIWDALPENPMGCAAFIRGVKFAEKEHGITGVDDE